MKCVVHCKTDLHLVRGRGTDSLEGRHECADTNSEVQNYFSSENEADSQSVTGVDSAGTLRRTRSW
jgi:hypothetical protein